MSFRCDFDFDTFLLGLLTFVAGSDSVERSKEKTGLGKFLSKLVGCLFLFSGVMYFVSSFSFDKKVGDPDDGEEGHGSIEVVIGEDAADGEDGGEESEQSEESEEEGGEDQA